MGSERPYDLLATEQRNDRARGLDQMDIPEILATIAREDALVPRAVAAQAPSIARAVELVVARLRRGGRLLFAGAGTSGRLGVIEAAECPPTFGTPPELVQAVIAGGSKAVFRSVEGAEDDPRAGARAARRLRATDVLVGIAASGVTPYVQGALAQARRRKAGTVLVTCNRAGVPQDCADVVIAPATGPEVVTGSTRLKAGTATKLVLNMLTVATMVRLGKVYENLMVDLQQKSTKLKARARRIVRTVTGVDEADADRALAAAGGQAKTAIVMIRHGCSRRHAEALLAKHGGSLRKALEVPCRFRSIDVPARGASPGKA
ncbi:MAG: N-acetylmuramic acid 6-phosphate etherase [Planctomycetes bacterium]|nr:N-acetylmuramic acid 6-phosphate etherase [Planctomycetota bacterium]